MKDLFGYSVLAFWAGVLLNFVPCVLPVIPVKIRIVLREIQGDARSRIFAAISLLSGTVCFFLLLGGATAYLELAWGDLFRSKWFLSALAAFFFFTGIATFANWTVRLPEKLYRIPMSRYSGAFLIGALSGVLSTPCSGPFLGAVLAYTLTQPTEIIMLIFTWIGIGLAIPYIFLLLYPGLMNHLSFAGTWTIRVKQIMGFILLAGAVFFGRVFIPEAIVSMLWWVFCAAVIVWALIIFKQSSRWPGKMFAVGAMIAVLFIMLLTQKESQLKWQVFTSNALKESLKTRLPVLIEFTAKWCLNCEVLEKTAYANKEVAQAAKRVKLTLMRLDMTDFNDSHRQLLEKYGGTALPFAVLMDGNGKVTNRFQGMFSAKALKKAIDHLKISKERVNTTTIFHQGGWKKILIV
jgi:thiol:disulfide interchange protein